MPVSLQFTVGILPRIHWTCGGGSMGHVAHFGYMTYSHASVDHLFVYPKI